MPYRGILTINAIIKASHIIWLDQEEGFVGCWMLRTMRFMVPMRLCEWIRAMRRGIDPTNV